MAIPFGGQSQQRWGDNTLNSNEPMRDFLLTDLSGKPCMTADARKKGMLVLAFFNTTDPVCAKTLPYLQTLADAYKESGKLTVWGISQDDEAATTAFATQHGLKFPLLLDRNQYHSMSYGVTALPTICLANGKGMILKKVVGFRPSSLNAISLLVAGFAEVEAVVLVTQETALVAAPPAKALPAAT